MKYLSILLAALVLLSACAFHPVQSEADFAAMQTATAAVPPIPTIAPVIVPPTATEALVPTTTPTPEPTACEPVILGNIRNGVKTAFKPGDAPYSQVIPEATFCTMQEAVDAGFAPYRGN